MHYFKFYFVGVNISFSDPSYSAVEDTGSVIVTVQVFGLFERELPFSVSTNGELSQEDVIPQTLPLSFQPGNDAVDVDISIVVDEIVEMNDTFTLSLSSSDMAVSVLDPMASVMIIDDDGENSIFTSLCTC